MSAADGLVRHWSFETSQVNNEFAGPLSAEHEWKQRMKAAGYTHARNREWHKPGHPVVIEPRLRSFRL